MINKIYILIIFIGFVTCNRNEHHYRKNLNAELNQKVKLPCFVENGHKFIWMKSDQNEVISIGDMVMANRHEFRIETECDKTELSSGCWIYLTIEKVDLIDEGVYVCQKDTMHSNYINLTILVPPYIKNEANSSMDINVIEGKDVELVCDAFGKPDPIIKWFAKNEYFISTGKNLILRNVSRNSIKDYECIADNGVNPSISKTFTLRTLYAPSIVHFELDESNLKDQDGNTTLKLKVEFSGNPKPKLNWIINGELKNSSITVYRFKDTIRKENVFSTSIELKKNIDMNSLIEFKIENLLGGTNSSFRLKDIHKYSQKTIKKLEKFYSEKKRTILTNTSVKNIEIGHKNLLSYLKPKNNVERKLKMEIDKNILKENEEITSLEINDKIIYIVDQHETPQIVQKGEGWREAMEGIWACTVCLMCINNLCFCIQWFS